MDERSDAGKPQEISTGAAWLGFGIAARGAYVAVSSMALVVLADYMPWFGDFVLTAGEQQGGLRPDDERVAELMARAGDVFGTSMNVLGAAGVAIGLALLVCGAGLLRGSHAGRRGSVLFLGLDAALSLAACVWSIVLMGGAAGAWLRELQAVGPNPVAMPHWLNLVSTACSAAFAVAIAVVLLWLAARPFARAWCDARSFSARAARG